MSANIALLPPEAAHQGAVGMVPSAVALAGNAPSMAVAGELVDRVLAELPALAELSARERLLAAAWLVSLRGPDSPGVSG